MDDVEPPAERIDPGAGPWDGFVVGPENALAHAGALALARGDRAGVSPLVVHGPAGVGKSRLLTALVAEFTLRRPEASAAHVTAEDFAAACAEAAARPGGWGDLRDRFRAVDLLVVEDLHGLERSPLAAEELTHTLDALEARGAAVAVSARTPPGRGALPARLANRLAGGLAVRLEPPGAASRRRYLLERARARGLTLSAQAVDRLAAEADGYRAIDGLLARLVLERSTVRPPRERGRPIGEGHAAELLAEDGSTAGAVDVAAIQRAVAARFGVRPSDLRSASRRAALVEPRHLAMYLARTWTGLSYAAIGAAFGGRDPKTVRHAIAAAEARLAADPALAAAAAALSTAWRRPPGDPAEASS